MTTLHQQIQKQIAESEAETNQFILEQTSSDISDILAKEKIKAIEILAIREVFE